MARPIDKSKMMAIEKATIDVVVIEGVSGASISKIADKAKVSVGYLYRFYKGKRELLETLFEERFQMINNLLQSQVDTQKTVKDIVSIFVSAVYEVAKTDHKTISFTHKLLSDFSFELPKKLKGDIKKICAEVIAIGRKTGEIDSDITNEIFYTVIVGGTLNFINIRLREIFEKKEFSQDDVDCTTFLLLKTLSPNHKK